MKSVVVFSILALLLTYPFVGISPASAAEECCCFPTSATYDKSLEVGICLDGLVRCGQCSATYEGYGWAWGCMADDDCEAPNVGCGEEISFGRARRMQENTLDDELCQEYGPECICQLPDEIPETETLGTCNEAFCGPVDCECP